MNILFHICCSNCNLFPFRIVKEEGHSFSGFWYNPNIHPYEEYSLRLESLRKLSAMWDIHVQYIEDYRPADYFKMFGYKNVIPDQVRNDTLPFPAFPDRCRSCYLLRLEKTAEHAKTTGLEAFSTTLLISPYQDFEQIVSTGNRLADKYNISFYYKDFRPYFREAMNLARELGLYRQKYCGCIFSREERMKKVGSRKYAGTTSMV